MLSCSMTALSRQITRAYDHCNSDGNIVKCVKYGRYGKICVFDRNRHFRCVWIVSFSMTFNDHERRDARVPFSGGFCNEFGRLDIRQTISAQRGGESILACNITQIVLYH